MKPDNVTLEDRRRRVAEAEAAVAAFDAEIPQPASLPKGTPDRRRLDSKAFDEYVQRRFAGGRRDRYRRLTAELQAAKTSLRRSESARLAARLRAADPRTAIHAAIKKELIARGYRMERSDGGRGGSRYYERWNSEQNDWDRVRVSDHRVPETAEREYNVENGGFSWATCGISLIISDYDSPDEAVSQLREMLDGEEDDETN